MLEEGLHIKSPFILVVPGDLGFCQSFSSTQDTDELEMEETR